MYFLWLIGKIFLVLIATVSIAQVLYINRGRMGFVWSIWKRFRLMMLVEILFVLILTITVIATLCIYIPFLRWGWLNLFISGGGNILIAPVVEGSESSSMLVRILPPIFFVALLVALPFIAHCEEEIFRRGYHEWGEIARQSVKFGLVHILVGIPLAAGIALIIPGFFFAWKYRTALSQQLDLDYYKIVARRYRSMFKGDIKIEFDDVSEDEAVMVSTTYHTFYNSLVVLLILIFVVAAI